MQGPSRPANVDTRERQDGHTPANAASDRRRMEAHGACEDDLGPPAPTGDHHAGGYRRTHRWHPQAVGTDACGRWRWHPHPQLHLGLGLRLRLRHGSNLRRPAPGGR